MDFTPPDNHHHIAIVNLSSYVIVNLYMNAFWKQGYTQQQCFLDKINTDDGEI